MARVAYGSDYSFEVQERCRDCGVAIGQLHVPGCCVEICGLVHDNGVFTTHLENRALQPDLAGVNFGSAFVDANADFLRALADRVRNHAVDADRGDHEAEHTEQPEQEHVQAALSHTPRDDLFHGSDIAQRHVRQHRQHR